MLAGKFSVLPAVIGIWSLIGLYMWLLAALIYVAHDLRKQPDMQWEWMEDWSIFWLISLVFVTLNLFLCRTIKKSNSWHLAFSIIVPALILKFGTADLIYKMIHYDELGIRVFNVCDVIVNIAFTCMFLDFAVVLSLILVIILEGNNTSAEAQPLNPSNKQ